MLGLVDDLLGLARVEAGEEVVRVESVRLINVVEDSLMLVRPLAEKKGLRIRVRIAVRDFEHVFEPFWRADPTARNPAGSTGLGLSVARHSRSIPSNIDAAKWNDAALKPGDW